MRQGTAGPGIRLRWIGIGGLAVATVLALAWLALPTDHAPGEAGLVRVAEAAPTIAPATPATEARPLPPLTPEHNAATAVQSNYLVAREARDRAWADRSEAALRSFMRGIAQVDRRGLAIKCTTSVCEVSGLAVEDAASGSMAPAWAALEHDTAGDALREKGLERSATTFGTGRVREAFLVYYRRIEAPARSAL